MKLLIALGHKKDGVTPYTMAQIEDHAYGEKLFKAKMEEQVQVALLRQYNGVPRRLLWIEPDDGFAPPPEDLLTALVDGAQIPWTILEERRLDGSEGS